MAAAETDEGAWRELAERLLQHRYPGAPDSRVEVVMGELPNGWPADLPLPRGARLLGSIAASLGDSKSAFAEAVLDADDTPRNVLSSYRGELESTGWAVVETPRPPRFAFSSGGTGEIERQSFLRKDDGPLLTVTVVTRSGSPSDVRLRLDADVRRPPPQHSDFLARVTERIPNLRAPAQVLVSPSGGGGGGERHWTVHGTALTEMAVGDLETHFSSQLSEAGWTRLGGGNDGVVAWSSWRLPGEQVWKGVLLIHAAFFEGERALFLRVEAEPRAGSSFFSAASAPTP